MKCPACGSTATHVILNLRREPVGFLCRGCRQCWSAVPLSTDQRNYLEALYRPMTEHGTTSGGNQPPDELGGAP
jgi:transposase-like protein